MNKLLENMKYETNKTFTTNGAISYSSTLNKIYDLFALGGSMRQSDKEKIIDLFDNAYKENPTMALRCLFYLRDCNSGKGQGERRFFRIVINMLAKRYPDEMRNLIPYIKEYGRIDDIFELFDTPLETAMIQYIKQVIDEDENHLVYKWLPSINASSEKTKVLGRKFARAFNMTEAQYRHMLTEGRKMCYLVETLMSSNQWDKIAFNKLPSRAGLLYSKAFARREETAARYKAFLEDKKTTVNTGTLYPYDVVKKAADVMGSHVWYDHYTPIDDPNRQAANKYWENLHDYFNGAALNALCVCDTSGSMTNGSYGVAPIDVAISLALYTAEKANGPFKNHFISFSSRPQLIETKGIDFCEKVDKIYKQNLCENTNIEATFDLILNITYQNHLTQEDLPKTLIIISDMQFDSMRTNRHTPTATLMENIAFKWQQYGYKRPNLVFWNVNASLSDGNIPMRDQDGVTFVSGCSPVIFKSIMEDKTGYQICMDTLNQDRYSSIYSIKEL